MGLFNYDSKLMQTLGFIADLFVCNLMFLIFSLPVVTMGAAFSGLHYAMRTLANNEDDRSAIKQFFIGFRNGFLKSTCANLLFMVLGANLLPSGMIIFTIAPLPEGKYFLTFSAISSYIGIVRIARIIPPGPDVSPTD